MKSARLLLLWILALGFMATPILSYADVTLPNYAAASDLKTSIQAKGKAITDTITMVVAVLAIIGIIVGAGYFAVGNGEHGKRFLVGGIIALVLAGSAYGIASLIVSA